MNYFQLLYVESNIVCFIIFAIIFIHDLWSIDSQDKKIKFDRTLIAFMLYFVSDSIWASVIAGAIPKNPFLVLLLNISNMILMATITYCWFCYALAVERVPGRDERKFKVITAIPLALTVSLGILMFFLDPGTLMDDDMTLKPLYTVIQVGVPIIYVITVLFFTIGRIRRTEDIEDKKLFLTVGAFPLMVVCGGLGQVLSVSNSPIFCYSSTILMIIFYIRSMERLISADPLTGLNNRGQLTRYMTQENAIKREGRMTYVVMIDVNNFKKINDTYGHGSGDKALIIIADSLRKAMGRSGMPGFIGRYGGDEFVMVPHPQDEAEIADLAKAIRECISEAGEKEALPFDIGVSIGYDRLEFEGGDSFQKCLERADQKLYKDKTITKAMSHNKA